MQGESKVSKDANQIDRCLGSASAWVCAVRAVRGCNPPQVTMKKAAMDSRPFPGSMGKDLEVYPGHGAEGDGVGINVQISGGDLPEIGEHIIGIQIQGDGSEGHNVESGP